METRIALVGANGIGKTTFLKVMLQKVKPLKGKVKHEKVLKYAYYHQHLSEILPGDMTPLGYIMDEYEGLSLEKARSWIGR